MSRGTFTLLGRVANSDSGGVGVINWIDFPYTKTYSDNMTGQAFVDSVLAVAKRQQGIDYYDELTAGTHKLAIIYAGHILFNSGALHPNASSKPGTYTIGEMIHDPYDAFVSIGLNGHEFSHVLGIDHDDYSGSYPYGKWGIMCFGHWCGGSSYGECPAPLTPDERYRINTGWVSYTDVNEPQDVELTFNTDYGLSNVYILHENNSYGNGPYEHIIIENRQVQDSNTKWNRYINTCDSDKDGILVWRLYNSDSNHDLIEADSTGGTQQNSNLNGDAFYSGNKTYITDFSSPNLKRLDSGNYPSNAQINNISSSGFTMTASMGDSRFGELPENESWPTGMGFYNYYIGDNFTIPSGKTLTLEGTGTSAHLRCDLHFSSGKKIQIYGTVTSNYTQFSTKTAGDLWNGIELKSGGTMNVNGNIVIEYATIGMDISSSNLYFPSSKTTISNCRDWGILISNCAPTIQNVDFQNNGSTDYHGGVCIQGSGYEPYLKNITINGSKYGLYLTSSADAKLEYSEITCNPASDLSRINLYDYAGLDIDGRRNNIYDNTSANNWAIKTLLVTSSFPARRNYWGTSNPIRSVLFSDSTLVTDISGFAAADIDSAGAPAAKIAGEIAEFPFIEADEFESRGDWNSALSVYQDIIRQNNNMLTKRMALKSLLKLCGMNKYDYASFRALISNELKTAPKWYASSLDYLLCESLVSEGKYRDAINVFSEKAQLYSGNVMEVEMLSRIASIYGEYLHDSLKAKEFADRAATINPGQPILLSAYSSAGIEYDPWKYADKYTVDSSNPEEGKQMPGDDSLTEEINDYIKAYPNPANPTTTISYSLSSPSKVNLTVYNITGQKVATLVDGPVSSGVHTVKFDGSKFGSGLYFYKFASDKFTKTGKMMILK
ncbi:MAG: T9SS type A sorting domain-containing protein [Candidatus Latescibacterota bacterium]